jgi:hypothetical protein
VIFISQKSVNTGKWTFKKLTRSSHKLPNPPPKDKSNKKKRTVYSYTLTFKCISKGNNPQSKKPGYDSYTPMKFQADLSYTFRVSLDKKNKHEK